MPKWASQQLTEQKARKVRVRLQVETLQTQCLPPKERDFLQEEHLRQSCIH